MPAEDDDDGGDDDFRLKTGIPAVAQDAYETAASWVRKKEPDCHGLDWYLIAAIGKVETGHASVSADGSKPKLGERGDVNPWIVGPPLDGSGNGGNTSPIWDTDNGEYDKDTTYDRAVGPMQFLPSTWEELAGDANSDGKASPHNIYDAAAATGRLLCQSVNGQVSRKMKDAIRSYNNSDEYVKSVLYWRDYYVNVGHDDDDDGGSDPGRSWGGHQNGRIPDDELCPVPFAKSQKGHCGAMKSLDEMNKAFKGEFGRDLNVVDSYRTYAQQEATRERWCAKGNCDAAAPPGHSIHGWGKAIDFGGPEATYGTQESDWLLENGPQFKWEKPAHMKPGCRKDYESWHYEFGKREGLSC